MSRVCGSNKLKVAFHMDVGHRLSSWSCTDRSPWQYIKEHFIWGPGYTFLEHTSSLLHTCMYMQVLIHHTHRLYMSVQTYTSTPKLPQTHTMTQNACSSFKWQSIVLGCSSALCRNVSEQTSLLSCCSSALYSLSRVMWQHLWIIWPWELNQKGKKLTAAAKLRWQGKRAITMSLSLHGLHKKFHRCQSCTNRHCPPETFLCRKIGTFL